MLSVGILPFTTVLADGSEKSGDKQMPASPPNILLIVADDLGCQLSCYGETRVHTPQLDALASQGLLFRNFYISQSSCSPSRASLLTGRWPHQNGQIGLSHLGFRMHPGQKNLPALLKEAGYRTGIIGKLHVGPEEDFPWDWRSDKPFNPLSTREVKWVAEQSRAFFEAGRKSGKPFFYYVNFFDPHGPYTVDANQIQRLPVEVIPPNSVSNPFPSWQSPHNWINYSITDSLKKQITATMINMIHRLDAGVGLLLDELKIAGLDKNTLVVFIGDNGLPIFHGKTTSYEQGVHVPLLISGPGIKAGKVRNDLACAVDLMPTILKAAGVSVPVECEGKALQQSTKRQFLFTEMNFHQPEQLNLLRTVRDKRYKLLLNLTPDEGQPAVEMYDLLTDPDEVKNIAGEASCTKIRRTLETVLQEWRAKTSDPTLDTARVQRWKYAAERWSQMPKVKDGSNMVIRIPEGELELLK